MENKQKKGWKLSFQYALPVLCAALIAALIWYFTNGLPLVDGLRKQAEQGMLTQVRITQSGETVTVTDPERLELAAGVAQLLTVSLPGKDGANETAETEYLFTFTDGKTLTIGVSGDVILKNGKLFSPGGDKSCVAMFENITKGLFFGK